MAPRTGVAVDGGFASLAACGVGGRATLLHLPPVEWIRVV